MRFAAAWAPLSERLAWAARWRAIIAERRDDLARVVSDEIGKTPFEAMSAEERADVHGAEADSGALAGV